MTNTSEFMRRHGEAVAASLNDRRARRLEAIRSLDSLENSARTEHTITPPVWADTFSEGTFNLSGAQDVPAPSVVDSGPVPDTTSSTQRTPPDSSFASEQVMVCDGTQVLRRVPMNIREDIPECNDTCDEDVDQTFHDCMSWYSGTFLGYKTSRGIVPVYVHECRVRSDKVMLIVSDSEDRYSINFKHPNLVYELPDLGLFVSDHDVKYLERVHQRQWRRGNRQRCCVLTYLHPRVSGALDSGTFRNLLSQAYNSKRPRLVAVGDSMKQLYYNDRVIGAVREAKDGTNEVMLSEAGMAKVVTNLWEGSDVKIL